jgi:peptidoglycan/xylan/chitin deacetylase (PgdA/CDA1 family)
MDATGGPWPGGCVAAVSLTFDDGMRSQLERAVPILEEHGLRGTFYLNPRGDDWEERLAPWRAVAARGHELGNHTCHHPCSRAFRDDPRARGLEDMTLEELAQDIDLAEERLRLLSGVARRSFAYPCYHAHVGEGRTRQSYVPLVAARFVAARNKGEVPNHPATCDLHFLWSFPAERMSGAELVGLAERAAREGRWTILTFHGVHEGHLPVADVDLRELCRHLASTRDRIWTAPVAEVAEAVASWRERTGVRRPAR